MKKYFYGFITLVIIIAAILLTAKYLMESSFPDYDGEIRCEELGENVDVFRDTSGIPIIYASSESGAAFALGYVHAQERLFQMEMMRRLAEGRLSEIIGEKTVEIDRVFRTLGIKDVAGKSWQIASPETKALLNSYTAGINKYIKENKNNLSIEFDLLDFSPEPWQPMHSFEISKLLAWELNLSWWIDAALIDVAGRLNARELKDILPYEISISEAEEVLNLLKQKNDLSSFLTANLRAKELLGFNSNATGSNAWAVDSSKSLNTLPVLANDTHLALSLPDKWFFIIEHIKERTLAGFTIPGLPSVIIGTNKKIAWGLTNLMADQCDYFLIKTSSDSGKYLYDGKQLSFDVITDSIKIKNSPGVEKNILKTVHGPVVTGRHIFNFLYKNRDGNSPVVAINWSALKPNDDLKSFMQLNRAGNWEEFRNALKDFSAPGQNFIYSDSDGNIGIQSAGKIPARKRYSGRFIYDGSSSKYISKGSIPFDELPHSFNPSGGYIANANNNPGNKNIYISNLWEPATRYKRIVDLLNKKEKFTVGDFKLMQNDLNSVYAFPYIREIKNAFAKVKIKDENLRTALSLLYSWDYEFSKYSQPAAVYSVFFAKLLYNTLFDELGETAFKEYTFISNVPLLAMQKLLQTNSSLWDDKATEDIIESKYEIIRNSMVDAVALLEEKLGKDPALWQWGRLHTLTLKHPFHGVASIIDSQFDIGDFEMSGSGTTLMNTGFSFSDPYEVKLGAAMRFIYDFASPDTVTFIMPAGQSGHPRHKHYGDMTKKWLNGEYIQVNISAGNKSYKHKLSLLAE